jgi:pimeloyl-ACP methyl ester carboxylesterase
MNLKLRPRAPASPAWTWGRAAAFGATGLAASALLVNHLARRAEKEHRPLGRFASIGKMQVHYVDRGSGPPVLVLHGNGGVVEELASSGLIDHLARSHRVIALDRPGFGLTTRQDRGWSPEREARVLLALMHRLGLDRPVIVAHSWATLVAISLALEEPDAVSGLVLVAGYYYPTARKDVAMQRLVAMPLVGDVLRNTIWPLLARVAAPLAFKRVFSPLAPTEAFLNSYPVPMAVRPSQLRAVADDTVDMPKAAARLAARYGELQIPVDLIAGADDRMVSTAHHSRRLNRELHNSFLDEVPGVGHMVHHAHPKLIERRVAHVFQRGLKPIPSAEPAT